MILSWHYERHGEEFLVFDGQFAHVATYANGNDADIVCYGHDEYPENAPTFTNKERIRKLGVSLELLSPKGVP